MTRVLSGTKQQGEESNYSQAAQEDQLTLAIRQSLIVAIIIDGQVWSVRNR